MAKKVTKKSKYKILEKDIINYNYMGYDMSGRPFPVLKQRIEYYYTIDKLKNVIPFSKIEALENNIIDPKKDVVYVTHRSSIPAYELTDYKTTDKCSKANVIVLNKNTMLNLYNEEIKKKKRRSYMNYVKLLEKYIDNPRYKLVLDTYFLKGVLKDRIVIDEQVYSQIINMLKSKDKSDKTVIQDILGACNYEESKMYLLMIIQEFGYCSNRAMRNYFKEIISKLEKDEFIINIKKEVCGGYYSTYNTKLDCYTQNIKSILKSKLFDDKEKSIASNFFTNKIVENFKDKDVELEIKMK